MKKRVLKSQETLQVFIVLSEDEAKLIKNAF